MGTRRFAPEHAGAADLARLAGGVLDPREFLSRIAHARIAPDPRLTPWVEWYWFVEWDLPRDVRRTTRTLPTLGADLTIEYGDVSRRGTTGPGTFVTGAITSTTFDIELTGHGGVAGIRFRPGVPSTVFRLAADRLTDRVLDLDGPDAPSRASGTPALPDELRRERRAFEAPAAVAARRLDECLLAIDWPDDPRATLVADLVDRVDADPDATSLARIAGVTGYSTRSVQRLFTEHLGVGVSWHLRRKRLQHAVRLLDLGYAGTLADLAGECGWYDQSHFTADFRRVIGCTPAAYRAGVASR